jgi:acyl-CoA synthetase (AMP-forming)/AMP-acid ligase II
MTETSPRGTMCTPTSALGHPAIKLAAVVGVAHLKWEERPVPVVTLRQGASLSESEMLEYLAPQMVRWWLPDRVLVRSELPMTATGKIRKATLRDELRHVLSPAAGVAA